MRSTQVLQFNQIQCGNVTGVASPSTLAFTKLIKVDLLPTRVDSSARAFILLLSVILIKRFFFHLWRHMTYCINGNSCTVKTRPMSMELPSWRSNFQSLWKACYLLSYDMLFWKLEQWIERQFVPFVHSSLAIRKCTKWANGLSIHCSSFQNVFLCYFKNIDSFFMCLRVLCSRIFLRNDHNWASLVLP